MHNTQLLLMSCYNCNFVWIEIDFSISGLYIFYNTFPKMCKHFLSLKVCHTHVYVGMHLYLVSSSL